jgi:hypothetical protein
LLSQGFREARPVLGHQGRVIAQLVGRPKDIGDKEWNDMQLRTTDEMGAAFQGFRFTQHQLNHRRAECPAVDAGPSFGGGQRARIVNCVCDYFLIHLLIASRKFKNVGYQQGSF